MTPFTEEEFERFDSDHVFCQKCKFRCHINRYTSSFGLVCPNCLIYMNALNPRGASYINTIGIPLEYVYKRKLERESLQEQLLHCAYLSPAKRESILTKLQRLGHG